MGSRDISYIPFDQIVKLLSCAGNIQEVRLNLVEEGGLFFLKLLNQQEEVLLEKKSIIFSKLLKLNSLALLVINLMHSI